jgi:hypothetical protein
VNHLRGLLLTSSSGFPSEVDDSVFGHRFRSISPRSGHGRRVPVIAPTGNASVTPAVSACNTKPTPSCSSPRRSGALARRGIEHSTSRGPVNTSSSRTSAGTTWPTLSRTTSPGTSAVTSTDSARPFRMVTAVWRLSYTWWVDKHNAHHAHPNNLTTDPDVHPGALVFDAGQALRRRGPAGWLTRYQAWLFFPLLTLEAMNLHVSSARALMRPGRATACWSRYSSWCTSRPTWLLHARAQGHAHPRARPGRRPAAAAGAHLPQPAWRALRRLRARRAELPDRAPPVPEHAAPNLRHAQVVARRFCEDRSVSYEETNARASYTTALRHLHAVGADLRTARRRP